MAKVFHTVVGETLRADWGNSDGIVFSGLSLFYLRELHSFPFYSFLPLAEALIFSPVSGLLRWKLRSSVSLSIFSNKTIKAKNFPLWLVLATSHRLYRLNYIIIQFELFLIFPVMSA